MKKILSLIVLSAVISNFNAQTNVYSNGFDSAFPSDWITTNQSTPSTTTLWFKSTSYTAASTQFSGGQGQAGGLNSLAGVNYTSTSGAGDISNWLITGVINVQDGDIVSFYARKGTSGTVDYPDRLELRYSTVASTVVPSGGSTDVGSFTNLGVSVNPDLLTGFVFPKVWTKYSFTVSGVGTTPVPVTFAFRYYVTDGGPSGNNSDLIGIDTFSVDRPNLAVTDVNSKNKSSVYPIPAKDVLNLKSVNSYNNVKIYNISGQLVAEKAIDSKNAINISALKKGVYFIEFSNGTSKESFKFIKD